MGNVTRHALRVYAALANLKGNNADVLDALVPFFDPILEKLNGTVFNPTVFASGVHFLYRWRFNRDIAEQFIPRLERKGYLEKQIDGRNTIYLVRYNRQPSVETNIVEMLEQIIDEFEKFPPRVTDLLTYSRTRDELKEVLIKFLVAVDAYSDGLSALRAEEIAKDESKLLAKLDEGGPTFNKDDRYMAARFVRAISSERPDWIPHLAHLAAIGLLTEVVEDFVKPMQPAENVKLTIVVDAPLALDYLGCSGRALQQDVKGVFDSLREIGCSFVVFPSSCMEMRRNLTSMLALPAPKRRGYTHEAMVRGEVLQDFVEAVANDPEHALESAGIQTKHIALDQYPNSHLYFSQGHYEDFFETVRWVSEVEPREHDAMALTLVMRLREARHSADVFKSGYVLVTRNAAFVRASRQYCIANRFISSFHQGPLIHQRELATLTWLRTGLGKADERIPMNHLLATCDRVLQIRAEVPEAVAATLRRATPDKLEQFELLLQDHRSIRKLADETLNDENVVTAENAEHLLDVMRQATAEEARIKFESVMKEEQARHRELQHKNRERLEKSEAERANAVEQVGSLRLQQNKVIAAVLQSINSQLEAIANSISALMLVVVVVAIAQYLFGWLEDSFFWKMVLNISGLLGAYHLMMALLGKPMLNLTSILNLIAPKLLERKLVQLNLDHLSLNDVEFRNGQVFLKPRG